jgi:hypothetical protein
LFNKQIKGEREIQNFNAWHLKYGREKKRVLPRICAEVRGSKPDLPLISTDTTDHKTGHYKPDITTTDWFIDYNSGIWFMDIVFN